MNDFLLQVTTSIFEEYPFLIPFVSLLLAVIGAIATFLYFRSTTKNKRSQDNKQDLLNIEDRAREKLKDDLFIAKEVKEEARKVAIDTKGEMMDIIHNIVERLQNEINKSRMVVENEIKLLTYTVDQVKVDLKRNIEFQQIINDRMQKSVDFMNQFLWGAGAKSMPPYTQGEEETKEHADKPSEGIFMNPDSSETQEHKDETGSTKSEDIQEAKDKEAENTKTEREKEEKS